jgi:hypothetical protein
MRSGFATAVVLVSLALVSIVGWAASRAHAPAVPSIPVATTKPAPPPPPACRAEQLSIAYAATPPTNAEHNFGFIEMWDRSARPCTLIGPIVVAGLDPAGHVMTTVLTYQVAVDSELTARGTKPRGTMELANGERAASLILSAGFKYDALRRYRTCTRRIEPAMWRLKLSFGGVLTAANADPQAPAQVGHPATANNGLLTCRGVLDSPQPIEVVPA